MREWFYVSQSSILGYITAYCGGFFDCVLLLWNKCNENCNRRIGSGGRLFVAAALRKWDN